MSFHDILMFLWGRSILSRPADFAGTPKQVDDCADKQTNQRKGYRDLAQSIRSANASEEAAWLSYLQTRAAIVGAALVLLTLAATAWAAWAAADAARIADKSAVASIRAADAAEASLQTNRAWISFERFSYFDFDGQVDGTPVKNGLGARLHFENSGNTPALRVDLRRSMRCVENDAPIPIFSIPAAAEPQVAGVGPRRLFNSGPAAMNEEESTLFRQRKRTLYVYCLIQYRDIYKDALIRETEVCIRLNYAGEQTDKDGKRQSVLDGQPVGPQNRVT